jgi:hypothetical protein
MPDTNGNPLPWEFDPTQPLAPQGQPAQNATRPIIDASVLDDMPSGVIRGGAASGASPQQLAADEQVLQDLDRQPAATGNNGTAKLSQSGDTLGSVHQVQRLKIPLQVKIIGGLIAIILVIGMGWFIVGKVQEALGSGASTQSLTKEGADEGQGTAQGGIMAEIPRFDACPVEVPAPYRCNVYQPKEAAGSIDQSKLVSDGPGTAIHVFVVYKVLDGVQTVVVKADHDDGKGLIIGEGNFLVVYSVTGGDVSDTKMQEAAQLVLDGSVAYANGTMDPGSQVGRLAQYIANTNPDGQSVHVLKQPGFENFFAEMWVAKMDQ